MKKILGLFIVLLFSVGIIKPLMGNGYFPMHDDTQIARVVVMGRALREGQFPVRWVSDLGFGYGYPIFNFYGPLPYYVGGSLYALGVPGLSATKIMMGLGMILAGVAMYLCVAQILGVLEGIVAAVLYMYAPYHAVQLYVRGAIGELWALVFLPIIVLGIHKAAKNTSQHYSAILCGLGLGGVILSHTLLGYSTFVIFLILSVIWSLFRLMVHKNIRSDVWWLMKTLAVGLGISAFFWLPAIAEMHFTNVAAQVSKSANYQDHFVCLSQFWSSIWGYGGSAKGCVDGLSFMLGKAHIIFSIAALASWLIFSRAKDVSGFLLVAGLCVTLIGGFFATSISSSAWSIMPLFAYIQYPWRFLAYMIFGTSILSSIILTFDKRKVTKCIIGGLMCIAAVLLYGKWFRPQYLYYKQTPLFEVDNELRYTASKISDEYLPKEIPRPKSMDDIVHDTIQKSDSLSVEPVVETDTYARFHLKSTINQSIVIKRAYFPGWKYLVNGVQTHPDIKNGLPSVDIPSGDSVVEILFTNTPVRLLGNMLSLMTLGCLLFYYSTYDKKNNT